MAEDLDEDLDEGGEGGGDSGGGSSESFFAKKKKLIMIVAPVLLLLLATAGVFFSGLADPVIAMLTGGGGERSAEPPPKEAHPGAAPVFYEMPEMLVNLNAANRKKAFLKIRVALELAGPEDTAKVDAVMPRIVDNFQVYLRELRLEDLQGSAGMYRLHEELLTRVNAAIKPVRVNDVLFKEMLVQ
ncbi:MAG: flagellar basal body-associated FliL family protein [Alphaproteobacteria bacterium]